MTRSDLENLKSLPVPPPGDDARANAIAAAMAAYDAANGNNSHDAPQADSNVTRLNPEPHAEAGREKMSTFKVSYAMAACLATAVVAPTALYMTTQHLEIYGPQMVGGGGRVSPTIDDVRTGGDPTRPKRQQLAERAAPAKQEVPAPALEKFGDDRKSRTGEQGELQPGVVVAQPATPMPRPAGPAVEQPRSEAPSRQIVDLQSSGYDKVGRPSDGSGAKVETLGQAQSAPAAAAPATKPSALHRGQVELAPGYLRQLHEKSASADKSDAARLRHGEIAAYAPLTPPADNVVVAPQEYRDQHRAFADSPVKQVASEPVSTFSLDVDTASYSFVRRNINTGHLPPKDAVRVEELINYFPYDYAAPETAAAPFQPSITITPAPWNASRKLIHIGIKGYELRSTQRRANLVFLIDVSGSMGPDDRLPLVKNAFRMLVDELQPDDTVGIVTYASGSGVALKPTKVADKAQILAAIDRLGAGGSTAGAQGIQDAYALAEANFDKVGVNRIILATDGDFNVGITNRDELKGFVERKRDKGIFLSILGVGQGNYNDATMQALAQNGNGTAAYVDTLSEARKLLVEEASSMLFPIAKDVKIQVEFNPALVAEYRLVGYETRGLKREDFNNDKVDAAEVGSGHSVTAIYEITPVGSPPSVDALRYGAAGAVTAPAQVTPRRTVPADEPAVSEYGFFKMRYKLPKEDASNLLTVPLTAALEKPSLDATPADVRFSLAVAGFGQLLRGSPHVAGGFTYDDVIRLAETAKGADHFGYRSEFVNLVRLAKSASGQKK